MIIRSWSTAVLLGVSGIIGCHRDVGASASSLVPSRLPISVAPVIDLGVIPSGSSIRHIVPFSNVSNDTRRVSTIFTSCSCLSVTAAKRSLVSCENSYLEIALDMKKNRCSLGPLSFQVDGCDEKNTTIMSSDVRVSVVPPDELEPLSAARELGVPCANEVKSRPLVAID